MSVIAVDWGSTNLRAYRLNAQLELEDRIDAAYGIKNIEHTNYESVLESLLGDWLADTRYFIFSGMITSRQGWIETPYVACPVTPESLVENIQSQKLKSGLTAYFIPGACCYLLNGEPATDVMRGEEVQLLGLSAESKKIVVLPGTHSKWVQMNTGSICAFCTYMTGELFELVRYKSLAGQLASTENHIAGHFLEGVNIGYKSDQLMGKLFSARSSVLLEQRAPETVHSYLSGVLIGTEIKQGMAQTAEDYRHAPIELVGSDALVKRYKQAFDALSLSSFINNDSAEINTYQKIARILNV